MKSGRVRFVFHRILGNPDFVLGVYLGFKKMKKIGYLFLGFGV